MRVGDFVTRAHDPVHPGVRLSEIQERLSVEGFIPVLDGRSYVGILTQSDALRGRGESVRDLLRPLPRYRCDDDLSDAIDEFLRSNIPALPVFDPEETFLGVITPTAIGAMVSAIAPSFINITVADVQGPPDFELAKSIFLSDLNHHSKNPIQKIISTAALLREERDERARQVFCSIIEANAKQLDLTINRLSERAFRSEAERCSGETMAG